jgi:microcystin-dependent protein
LAHAASFTTSATGGVVPIRNQQPALGVNHLVALVGTYPSPDHQSGSQGEPVLGEITMFAGNFAPRGYAFAEGQLLPIAQHTALFSLYGTTYGGDGETTFALPDLRGRTVVGTGSGPGLPTRVLGETFGENQHTLSASNLPEHNHGLSPHGGTTDNAGANPVTGLNNHQPSIALNMEINTVGIFEDVSVGGLARIRINPGAYGQLGGVAADGGLLNIASNTAMFSLMGTTYGGDGETTFGMPDFSGRNSVHKVQGPGLTDRNIGQKLGLPEIHLTQSSLPTHNHIKDATDPFSTIIQNAGLGNPADNMQPGLVTNYLVRLFGTFPGSGEGFIGEIAMWGGTFAPDNWAMANGQLLAINSNQSLYSILGTTYGGDGETTFALPDLRGRVPVQPNSLFSNRLELNLGQKIGLESYSVGLNNMPSHAHDYEAVPTPAAGLAGVIGFGLLGVMRRRRHSA